MAKPTTLDKLRMMAAALLAAEPREPTDVVDLLPTGLISGLIIGIYSPEQGYDLIRRMAGEFAEHEGKTIEQVIEDWQKMARAFDGQIH